MLLFVPAAPEPNTLVNWDVSFSKATSSTTKPNVTWICAFTIWPSKTLQHVFSLWGLYGEMHLCVCIYIYIYILLYIYILVHIYIYSTSKEDRKVAHRYSSRISLFYLWVEVYVCFARCLLQSFARMPHTHKHTAPSHKLSPAPRNWTGPHFVPTLSL